MKPTLFSLAAAIAVLGMTGCGDNSQPTGAAPGADSKSVGAALDKAASTASDAAGKVMAEAKDALDKAQQTLDAQLKLIPKFHVVIVGDKVFGPYDTLAEARAKHREKGAIVTTLQSARK